MKKQILSLLLMTALLIAMLCVPAFAITEDEVEAAVSTSGKGAVTGNVLIWFLCAVAFLKVSQKIDSFLASLGVNVGRTGGSLLGDAMVAARGVSAIVKAGGGAIGTMGGGKSGNPSGSSDSTVSGSAGGFFKGGLIGMAGRRFASSSTKTATSQASAVHTAQTQSATSSAHTASATHTASSVHSGGVNADTSGIIQTDNTIQSATIQSDSSAVFSQEHTGSEAQSDSAVLADTMTQQEGIVITSTESQTAVQSEIVVQTAQSDSSTQATHTAASSEHIHTQGGAEPIFRTNANTPPTILPEGVGGAALCRSLIGNGKFANEVIGTVARGETRSTSCITGDLASHSLRSYMGFTTQDAAAGTIPQYSDVQIGGGRITGTEFSPGSSVGTAFAMYHAGQFEAPQGPHEQIRTADGALWYKQTAQGAAEPAPRAPQSVATGGAGGVADKPFTPHGQKGRK